jgi:hypothetical protein
MWSFHSWPKQPAKSEWKSVFAVYCETQVLIAADENQLKLSKVGYKSPVKLSSIANSKNMSSAFKCVLNVLPSVHWKSFYT